MLKVGAGSASKFATSVLQPTGGPTTSVLRAATAYDKLLQMESQPAVCSAAFRLAVAEGAPSVVHGGSVSSPTRSSGGRQASLYSQLFSPASAASTVDSTAGEGLPSLVPVEGQWKQGPPAKRRKLLSQSDRPTAVHSGSDSGSGMNSGSSGLDDGQEHELTHLLQDTAPDSTIKQDASHWKSRCKGCDKAGILPWRIK